MSLDPQDFYFATGLYQKIKFSEENFRDLFNLIFSPGRLDLYCPQCQKETTFEPVVKREKKDDNNNNSVYSPNEIYSFDDFKAKFEFNYFRSGRRFEVSYKCTRIPYSDHLIYFQMTVEDSSIMKIGQHPSIADLERDETKRYENVLPKDYRQELSKAIGLFSHGVGIGSFVYLRRIFERLIFDTFNEHEKELAIERSIFNSLRMGDKIESLKDYLPQTLVEKRSLYGILSKGIHSLDENTCKEFFPVVRAGIEFILDEKMAQIARKAREDKFNSDFAGLLKKAK